MTADQLWPDEAREAVAEIIIEATGGLDHSLETADAVLASLSVYAVPHPDQWEWGVTNVLTGKVIVAVDETHARRINQLGGYPIVRRRQAGQWEVAP